MSCDHSPPQPRRLGLSTATVSKAVTRLETRLGARLFNRTSRRLALTEMGRSLVGPATQLLADGEAAEAEALSESQVPRGLVRLAVPLTYGVRVITPLLSEFMTLYPQISIELHLDDARVDLIGEGFDAAIRIGTLPDSSMVARRLHHVRRYAIASPDYLAHHGTPTHPMHLADHTCLIYSNLQSPGGSWRFTNDAGEEATVHPSGRLNVNSGDALLSAVIAGLGIALLPDFIVDDAIADGSITPLLRDWERVEGAAHLLTPQSGPRPARLEVLMDFLVERLGKRG